MLVFFDTVTCDPCHVCTVHRTNLHVQYTCTYMYRYLCMYMNMYVQCTWCGIMYITYMHLYTLVYICTCTMCMKFAHACVDDLHVYMCTMYNVMYTCITYIVYTCTWGTCTSILYIHVHCIYMYVYSICMYKTCTCTYAYTLYIYMHVCVADYWMVYT